MFFLVHFEGHIGELNDVVGFGSTPSSDQKEDRLSGLIVQTEAFCGYAPTSMWEWLSTRKLDQLAEMA